MRSIKLQNHLIKDEPFQSISTELIIILTFFILLFLETSGSVFHGGFQPRFPFYSDEGSECSLQSGLFTTDSSTVGAT